MKTNTIRHLVVAILIAGIGASALLRAQQGTLTPQQRQQRIDTENDLQSIAIVERKVMMPMPDGVRLATDIYRPKTATAKVPTIWVVDVGGEPHAVRHRHHDLALDDRDR